MRCPGSALRMIYRGDQESAYSTWFTKNAERLKAFRSIRRGVGPIVDEMRSGRFGNDFRGSSLEFVVNRITEQKQLFEGGANAFYGSRSSVSRTSTRTRRTSGHPAVQHRDVKRLQLPLRCQVQIGLLGELPGHAGIGRHGMQAEFALKLGVEQHGNLLQSLDRKLHARAFDLAGGFALLLVAFYAGS